MNSDIYTIPNFSRFSVFTFSRFNLSESESDICVFIKEYKDRIKRQLLREEENEKTPFISFAEKKPSSAEVTWVNENYKNFFEYTPNESVLKLHFLSELGFINCMVYSPDGKYVVVGYTTGLIQAEGLLTYLRRLNQIRLCTLKKRLGHGINMNTQAEILAEFGKNINYYYDDARHHHDHWYPMFCMENNSEKNKYTWVKENHKRFLSGTPNDIVYNRWYFSEAGYITTLQYTSNGSQIIVGHSSGLIQMRHGQTGVVLCTLRNIQFPPKPIYSLCFSRLDDKVCYASCMDGTVYRIEIPTINFSNEEIPKFCIRTDPALESLNMQFYGAPGMSNYAQPFISQRFPALSMGVTADETKMVVGYGDTSIKIYDMETQEAEATFKVHKLRLQFIPKKLQRMHFGQVCALRCHDEKPNLFASAAWDKTLRIWDVRCKVGCVMTFEGVDICSDSIDLNRDQLIAGSWQPTEALGVWDLVARKRMNIIRVQNRRPDVDGEYIYACRYWRSNQFNRKGKYAIIGGSGTKCVEVINLHNRYITCSYPASGTILAITSHEERIAFGGTAPAFNIVTFHDPKHEKYESPEDADYDITKSVAVFHDDSDSLYSPSETDQSKSVTGAASTAASMTAGSTMGPSAKSNISAANQK